MVTQLKTISALILLAASILPLSSFTWEKAEEGKRIHYYTAQPGSAPIPNATPAASPANGSGAGTLANPYIINSFPYTFTGANSLNGETAVGMQGTCPALPCCSVLVFKVTLPANGVLFSEMLSFTPLAGTMLAYTSLKAVPTAYSDLKYVAGQAGNFCGFRDTLMLGRAYWPFSPTPYGQIPPATGLTSLYDFNNPSTLAGFMPAGDYYILYFGKNQQANLGNGTSDITFEYVEACSPLTVPSTVAFDTLEPNYGKDTSSFYVKNERSLDVIIDTSALNISGADSSQFSILQYPDTNLAVGDSTLMSVIFSPTSGGVKNANLEIFFSDTGCSTSSSIAFSGVGTEPSMVVSGNGTTINNNDLTPRTADNTDMGALVSNSGTITKNFKIANEGTDTLDLSGNPIVGITGSNEFAVSVQPSKTSVLPGDSTSFTIAYSPTSIGIDTAEVSIVNNDSTKSPYKFRIFGTGAGLNGLDFDGNGDYVNINTVSSGMAGVTAFTVETWIKVPAGQSGNDAIVGVNTSSNGTRMLLWLDDGKLEFHVGSNDKVISSQDMRDDTWHNLVFVFDNGTLDFYLDGAYTSTVTNTVPAFASNDKWSIGQEYDNGGPSDFLLATLDEFRLWKTARTKKQILDARYCEISNPTTDLLAYYTFNQGVPSGVNTGINSLTDWSLNGLNGTLAGFSKNGATSNFIAANNVGNNCTSFQVSNCTSSSYTSPSGKTYSSTGLIKDTLNTANGDSVLYIDLQLNFKSFTQNNLSNITACIGDTLQDTMTTNLVSIMQLDDAKKDWVEIDEVADSLINTNRSIFMWMRAAGTISGSQDVLVGINTSGTSTVTNFGIATNEQLWINDGGTNRNSGVVVTDGNWHFVGYTYNEASNKTQFWVDGVAAASFSNGQSISATSRISIGQEFDGSTASNFFDGDITEVSFWNEVLDSTDVSLIMNAAITNGHTKYNNLVAYYPSNSWCDDSPTQLRDYSGNGLHGVASTTSMINRDSLFPLGTFNSASHFQFNLNQNGTSVNSSNPFQYVLSSVGTYNAQLSRDFVEISDDFTIGIGSSCYLVIARLDSNVSCKGLSDGGATATVTGGTSPYTYAWSNAATSASITGLSPGTYSVTITDSIGDTSSTSITITEPDSLKANISFNNVACNGQKDGNIAVSPSGGTNPYSYAWSNGDTITALTNLDVGTYTVTITDSNACISTASANITQPTAIVASINQGTTACFAPNDSVQLTVTPQPGLTYEWQKPKPEKFAHVGLPGFSAGKAEFTSLALNSNDVPYVAYQDVGNSDKATVKKFDGTNWVTVGNTGFSAGFAQFTSLAIDGNNVPFLAYRDVGNGSKATVQKFNGTNWVTVGSAGFSAGVVGHGISLVFDNNNIPYIAYEDGGNSEKVTVKKFNGTAWVTVGIEGFSSGGITCTSLAFDSNNIPYVAYADDTKSDKATVKKFDGTNWVTVGVEGFSIGGAAYVSLAIDGNNILYLGYCDAGNGTKTSVKKFDGTSWITVGVEGFSTGVALHSSLAINKNNIPYLAYQDFGALQKATAKKFNGTNWETVDTVGFSAGVAKYTSLAISSNNQLFVAYQDGGDSNKATVMMASHTEVVSYTNSAYASDSAIYLLVATDTATGCVIRDTVSVIPCIGATVTINIDSNVSCNGLSNGGLTATGSNGTTPYSYAWSNAATTASISGLAAGSYTVTVTDSTGLTGTQSISITEPTSLGSSINIDANASSAGSSNGALTAAASGGTSPYTYAWSNSATTASITGLSVGSYTVTVTDSNGCTSTNSKSIVVQTVPQGFALAITEISYNGPESGSDTTEFIELYNYGSTSINLTGYEFTSGFIYSFPNVSVAAGDYIVVALDSVAVLNTFGVAALQWSAGGLSNGGEPIALKNASGALIDSLRYDDNAPWPDSADSYGYTLVLCDHTLDNQLGANWSLSRNKITGQIANGRQRYGSPGAQDHACSASLTVVATVDSNTTCNGLSNGAATSAVTDGTAPYSYAWSNSDTTASISGLAAGSYTVTVTDNVGDTSSASITITQPATLVASTVVDSNVSCFGFTNGKATASGSGGTSPYTYAWSNSTNNATLFGVTKGDYYVTVTDNKGCTDIDTVTITEPTALSVSNSSVMASTNTSTDGSATATPSGGTTPYSYVWNNGATSSTATGLSIGNYFVTISDKNGCQILDTVEVTSGVSITLAIDSNVSCNGFSNGAITSTVSNGTTPYSYAWSNSDTTASIFGLVAGSYTVTVTDSIGDTSSANITITQPALLVAASVVDSNISCNGFSDGGATASATGGTATYTYAWSNSATTASITGVAAGSYVVTITDSKGCSDTATANISEPNVLTTTTSATMATTLTSTDASATTTASGGTSPYTYVWNTGATDSTASNLMVGKYTVTITDNNGCSVIDSAEVTSGPSVTLAVDSNVSCNGLSDGAATASVTGGTTPYSYAWSNSDTTASIFGLTAGSYTVTVTDSIGDTSSTSITITEPAILVATSVVDSNISCNGFSDGGATASATGGTANYTYAWSNSATTASITGVAAGSYVVTITDSKGCSDTATANISEPNVLSTSVIIDSNTTCSTATDGGATVSTSGGTMPYSYSWSNSDTTNSISGVLAGTYVVTVSDVNGCSISDTAEIMLVDTIKPIVFAKNLTLYLASNGTASITTSDLDSISTDACGTPTLALSKSSFSCAEVGSNTVYLIATDVNGNIDSASSTVTVRDTINPVVAAQNLTAYLSASGTVNITAADINNGSYDSCGVSLALSNSMFTCSDTGSNTIYLIGTDVNGNVDSAMATVTVRDTIKPTVLVQNKTVYLGASGAATLAVSDINNGSYHSCGIATLTLSNLNYSCADTGSNTVYLKATDVNGNTDSAMATVTVIDTMKPVVVTQNLALFLNASGAASITTGDVDNGTYDSCGVSLSLTKSSFSCSDTGSNTIYLIATDVNGNVDSASAAITVSDTIKPTINTNNVTVYLDGSGKAGVTVADVNNSSSDNCSIASLHLSDTSFDCSNTGTNTVYLIGIDVNENVDSASATITVLDTIIPVLTVNAPVSICAVTAAGTEVTFSNSATDNCAPKAIVQTAGLASGSVFPQGTTWNIFSVEDSSGNTVIDSFSVEIYPFQALSIDSIGERCESDSLVTLVGTPTGGTFSGTGVSAGKLDPAVVSNGAVAITYTFTTAQSCTYSDSIYALVRPLPIVTLGSFADTVCLEDEQVACPVATPSGGIYSGVGVNGILFETGAPNVGVGEHVVRYTYQDIYGCVNTDSTVANVLNCFDPAGVRLNAVANVVRIFPNPNKGNFTIEHNLEQAVSAELISPLGQVVRVIELNNPSNEVVLDNPAPGMYMVRINGEGFNQLHRIVIQ